MSIRRFAGAVALTAGLAVAGVSQTPPTTPPTTPPVTPPAVTPPTTPPTTPPSTVPASNPDIEKGIEALKKNDVEGCLKCFKDACDKDKKLPPPKVILAEVLFQTNNGQAARAYLEQAGAEDPDHPDPYLLSAAVARAESRVMDAMLLYETALVKTNLPRWLQEQRPRWTRSCRDGLAQCYAGRNNLQGALEQLRAILEDEKKNALVRLQVARILFLAKQYEAAFKELETAFADDPKNPQIGLPEVNMARFWDSPTADKAQEAKNKQEAEDWMKKALAKHTTDVRAPREFARWLLNQGRTPDADAQLTKATGLDAKDNESNALIGLSHRYKKQYAEAEKIFSTLNLSDRTNIFYAWNLAICMAESADEKVRREAIAIASFVASGQQKNPEAFAVLAWCYFKNDRLDDAEKAMGSALQLGGNNLPPPDSLYFFSRILDKRGKGVEARDALKKAVDGKGAFVYRPDAEAFYKELVTKHGAPKDDKKDDKKDEKKDDKKDEKKP